MQTIGDVYHFLKSFDGDLKAWICNHMNKDGEPDESYSGCLQETIFTLFASLRLFPQLSNYTPCTGNFGLRTIKELKSIEEIFENKIRAVGDGACDFTAINRESKSILGTTSKYKRKFTAKELDLDGLVLGLTRRYSEYNKKQICVVIPSRDDFVTMQNRMRDSTSSRFEPTASDDEHFIHDAIVIDHDDLEAAFNKFKLYDHKTTKKTSELKGVHQEYTVWKNIKMKKMGEKCVLYAHMPRSGKTFMMVGSFKADNRSNYLVITTAPNETVYDYKKACKGHGYKVTHLGAKTKPITEGKNIILVSKQFLDRHDDIDWLKDLQIDMAFVDEGHYGGTTELAQDSLRLYAPDAFTVFMSATPDKIKYAYDIPESNIIRWDQEDIKLCQNINNPQSRIRLEEKYGPDFIEILNTFSDHQIKNKYLEYPDMHILTQSLTDDVKTEIITETEGTSYGISNTAILSMTTDKKNFQEPVQVMERIAFPIFGKLGKYTPDPKYPNPYMKRIADICKNSKSRYIGDRSGKVKVVLAFLPPNNINQTSEALINLLMNAGDLGYDKRFSDQYIVVSINSKKSGKPKDIIKNAVKQANNEGKDVLVLSGKQCHMAATIKECDIVLLLNDITSYDMIKQMMYRSMSPQPNKKFGFVVDLSLDRVLDTVVSEFASNLYSSSMSRKEALKYILLSKIVNINADTWIYKPGDHHDQITKIAEKLDNLYISNGYHSILRNMNRLADACFELSNEQALRLGLVSMKSNETVKIAGKDLVETIQDGIERKNYEHADNVSESEPTVIEKKENFIDILRFIIPFFSFITSHHEESSFLGMCNIIENDQELKKICIDHISTLALKGISSDTILKNLVDVYTELGMSDAVELNKTISNVKELVFKNRNDRHQMSKLLDEILLVHKNEKKMNAEIATPKELRVQMVDKVPESFWKNPSHKVLESSVGKIGFLNEIIDKFMVGLESVIPYANERYKHIVEKCVYFSDKNQCNIHIVKAILDPENAYKLNINVGDTVDDDMKFFNGLGEALPPNDFDLVIQNPPYNDSSGNKGANHTLWDKFTIKAIESWLKPGGYLVAVHPGNWRQGNSEVFPLFKEKQLCYLEIHNSTDGQKTFKCGTSYDWYILENTSRYTKTAVVGEDDVRSEIDMGDWTFLPNMMHDYIKGLMTNDVTNRLDITRDRSVYGTDNKKGLVSKEKTDKYCYPLINSIKKDGSIDFRYTCDDTRAAKGQLPQFGRTKFIFCNGAGCYKDMTGDIGFTEWGFAIYDTPENVEKIEMAFKTQEFTNILNAIKIIPSQKCNPEVMKLFRKDFWKDLLV
jgi:hypothetical protein